MRMVSHVHDVSFPIMSRVPSRTLTQPSNAGHVIRRVPQHGGAALGRRARIIGQRTANQNSAPARAARSDPAWPLGEQPRVGFRVSFVPFLVFVYGVNQDVWMHTHTSNNRRPESSEHRAHA